MKSGSGLVLIIDDDPDVRSALMHVLGDHGFRVIEAGTGKQAKAALTDNHPDVILLDLSLPDMSGLDVLVDLVKVSSSPIIVVSGRSGEADMVVGLDLGADDYITKPFSERELIARVNASLRRGSAINTSALMVFGPLSIDENTRDVTINGQPVELTLKEFDLLVFLARSPRHVYSRAQLLEQIWGSSPKWQKDYTVTEHIYRVRRKLDPGNQSRWIGTVRGAGYRFTPDTD